MKLCMLKQVLNQEKYTNTTKQTQRKEKFRSIDIEKQLKEQDLTVD